mmetsp:Transcript_22713/g.47235  ORF Transcript_22713/g.47235 Transcript_22713/m.47235 type:complete len:439 (-) Transcript_22713:34-1350(-)
MDAKLIREQFYCDSNSPTTEVTSAQSNDATTSLLGKNENTKPRSYGYGSAGTMSTWIHSSSSSSSPSSSTEGSSSSENNNPDGNDIHHVGIDLTVIDDGKISCDEECEIISTNSSYSDISSNGGGYYDRYARYQWTQNNNRYTICTTNNFKVVLSFGMWFVTYMLMGIFGGSVAYMHFPRTDAEIPKTLPDFGYDIIPYSCPRIPHVPHGNVQSCVLFILYSIIIVGVVVRWKPQFHPTTKIITWGGDGRLILQELFHLNCLVFLTRTTTVGLTGLPQPNPKCTVIQHLPVTFGNALKFVMGRGFPPHACGDLIYSGHVGCTLICMAVLHRNGFMRKRVASVMVWAIAIVGIYFTISCRSHYSVDVMLAFYFGYFLPEWYYSRSDGRIDGKASRWIRWLEVRPEDLEVHHPYDEQSNVKKHQIKKMHLCDKYPFSINV